MALVSETMTHFSMKMWHNTKMLWKLFQSKLAISKRTPSVYFVSAEKDDLGHEKPASPESLALRAHPTIMIWEGPHRNYHKSFLVQYLFWVNKLFFYFWFLCPRRHFSERHGWETFTVQRWASNSRYSKSYGHKHNPSISPFLTD